MRRSPGGLQHLVDHGLGSFWGTVAFGALLMALLVGGGYYLFNAVPGFPVAF